MVLLTVRTHDPYCTNSGYGSGGYLPCACTAHGPL